MLGVRWFPNQARSTASDGACRAWKTTPDAPLELNVDEFIRQALRFDGLQLDVLEQRPRERFGWHGASVLTQIFLALGMASSASSASNFDHPNQVMLGEDKLTDKMAALVLNIRV